jgi:hypothetical protein
MHTTERINLSEENHETQQHNLIKPIEWNFMKDRLCRASRTAVGIHGKFGMMALCSSVNFKTPTTNSLGGNSTWKFTVRWFAVLPGVNKLWLLRTVCCKIKGSIQTATCPSVLLILVAEFMAWPHPCKLMLDELYYTVETHSWNMLLLFGAGLVSEQVVCNI